MSLWNRATDLRGNVEPQKRLFFFLKPENATNDKTPLSNAKFSSCRPDRIKGRPSPVPKRYAVVDHFDPIT